MTIMDTKTVGVAQAEVKNVDTADPNGAFEAVISTGTVDRDGEIVVPGAFNPLPKSIPIHVDHRFTDVSAVVGKGVPFYDGDVLKVKGVFASTPEAQTVRTLVAEGMVGTMSVGFFDAKRGQKDGVKTMESAQLFEASFVSIPANPEALVTLAKSIKAGARNSAQDASRIQQMHDLSVDTGATCTAETGKSLRVATKAVAGSYEDRQEDIREALVEFAAPAIRAAYPTADPGEYEWRVNIVATFDDHVVYRIGYDDDDAWSVTYTWDGEVTVTGTPEAVTVDQVVSPSTEGTEKSMKPRQDATGADEADAQQYLELRAQALRILADTAA